MKPPTPDVSWEVSISWSPSWPMDDVSLPRSVRFGDRSFEQIDAVGRALRGIKKPGHHSLRGRVIRLASKDPLHGDSGPLMLCWRLRRRARRRAWTSF